MSTEADTPTPRIRASQLHGRITLPSVREPHYFTVYLWRDVFQMVQHVGADPDALAVTCFEHLNLDPETGMLQVPRKLGEIHYAANHWNINIVAHETLHALIHRMRVLWPSAALVMRDEFADAEEELAYEFGRWVERQFSWLWKQDPPKRPLADPTMRRFLPHSYWKSDIRMPAPDFFMDPLGTTLDDADNLPRQLDLFDNPGAGVWGDVEDPS